MPADRPKSHSVVFLHGVGGAGRAWTPRMASFPAAGLAVVAPDLPGCLADVGHLPNLEAPARFDAVVLAFLREALSSSRSSATSAPAVDTI
jgi:pimeloyl-ACP methyl ester carboxylesterase